MALRETHHPYCNALSFIITSLFISASRKSDGSAVRMSLIKINLYVLPYFRESCKHSSSVHISLISYKTTPYPFFFDYFITYSQKGAGSISTKRNCGNKVNKNGKCIPAAAPAYIINNGLNILAISAFKFSESY